MFNTAVLYHLMHLSSSLCLYLIHPGEKEQRLCRSHFILYFNIFSIFYLPLLLLLLLVIISVSISII